MKIQPESSKVMTRRPYGRRNEPRVPPRRTSGKASVTRDSGPNHSYSRGLWKTVQLIVTFAVHTPNGQLAACVPSYSLFRTKEWGLRMRRLLPSRVEMMIFATLALICTAMVGLFHPHTADLGVAAMAGPIFLVAAVMGLRRSPVWTVLPGEESDEQAE